MGRVECKLLALICEMENICLLAWETAPVPVQSVALKKGSVNIFSSRNA